MGAMSGGRWFWGGGGGGGDRGRILRELFEVLNLLAHLDAPGFLGEGAVLAKGGVGAHVGLAHE